MKTLYEIIQDHIVYRKQVWLLAKAELVKAYTGSFFGWAWTIISPSIMIVVYWFAFSIGLRAGKDVAGYPYFLWLISGMIPWFCIRNMFSKGASSLRRYTYLIKKVKFPISTIPTFVSISSFVVHLFLVVIMLAIFMLFGYTPSIYWLQLPIYMALLFVFFNTWSLFAGVLGAFSRDFLNFVKSITTALMWLSGIFYQVNNIENPVLREVMLLNPITVIINGYRNCLIYGKWFWEVPEELGNFVIVYAIMLGLAVWIFKRLRKEIPDVI